jgi:hypothetical protein
MKKILFISTLFLSVMNFNASAQKYGTETPEKFGRTLNVGAGIGYDGYNGYGGRPWSAISLNYEIDVARNITLAPLIGFSTYSNRYYWGNSHYPYQYYSYRETNIILGVKGLYYFDELFHAGPKWDFYAGASIGFNYHTTTWDYAYYGDQYIVYQSSPLYLAGHIGARFHITQKVGLFLDLSSAFSTFGVSFKL